MKITAVIDRFEGPKAILLFPDDLQVSWPKGMLPQEACEGDYLTMEIAVDREATKDAQTSAAELLKLILEQNK